MKDDYNCPNCEGKGSINAGKIDIYCSHCNGKGKVSYPSHLYISIANDFSETPGGRTIDSGNFSAELFLKEIMIPKMKEAKKYNASITIDLDGGFGYAASFLDEVFSNPIFSLKDKRISIEIISKEEPYLITEISGIWIENSFI